MIRYLTALAVLGVSIGNARAQTAPATPPAPKPPEASRPMTQDGGRPVGDNQNSRTAGERGPVLLDNFHLIEKLQRFDRERIPERVVHARGVGAHGEFVSYGDFSEKTRARVLSAKDKKTQTFVRFSTVIHPKGSPEQLRDPRGFSIKFYTEEGNWDLVGNHIPVFFVRDAMKFPDLVHAFKPSPVTNQQEPQRIFDFLSHVPESTHMLTFLYSDQGTPANLRQIDGFSVNAYKFVNAKDETTYVKFHWRSLQGLRTFTADEAKADSARNHSAFTEDLYEKIKKGDFPSWELTAQYMAPADLDKFDFDPLDDTKVWPGIPEVKLGKLTLNRVPENFFQFTEQVAFAPGMMPPGIEASEDKMLQARLFSYADSQRHRVGNNYLMLPVNKPYGPVENNNQDGQMNLGITSGDVNYEPSSKLQRAENPDRKQTRAALTKEVVQKPIDKPANFKQAGELYRSFTEEQKTNLIKNLTDDMAKIKVPAIRVRMVSYFMQADENYGTRLAASLKVSLDDVKAAVEKQK